MPTLATLLAALPELHFASEADTTRPVVGVFPVDAPPSQGWNHILAVADAGYQSSQQVTRSIGPLTQAGATALVVAAPVPASLLREAQREQLPVLTTTSGALSLARLAQAVSDLRHAEDTAQAQRLRELLERAHQLIERNAAADGVLQWLGEAVHGRAVILHPFDEPHELPFGIRAPDQLIRDLAMGIARSAALAEDGWSVRMYSVGPASPHPVLALVRRGVWPTSVNESVAQATSLLSWWLTLRAARSSAKDEVLAALAQMLISGQVDAARRTALLLADTPFVLITDGPLTVFVLDGPPDARSATISWARHRLGPTALVAPGHPNPRQIIVVSGDADHQHESLSHLTRLHGGYIVGASQPVTLHTVDEGHEQATRALAVARASRSQTAVFTREVTLVDLLPREPAYRWAGDLLAPLDHWNQERRSSWLSTTETWLAFGATGSARRTHLHRNTIERRVRAVGGALTLDLSSAADRAQLALALRIDTQRGSTPPEPGPTPRLQDLFSDPAVQSWANEYLNQLEPVLRRTLRVWIDANLQTGPASETLHLGHRTLRGRLRRAAAQLKHPLAPEATGDDPLRPDALHGPHRLVLAYQIAGEVGPARTHEAEFAPLHGAPKTVSGSQVCTTDSAQSSST